MRTLAHRVSLWEHLHSSNLYPWKLFLPFFWVLIKPLLCFLFAIYFTATGSPNVQLDDVVCADFCLHEMVLCFTKKKLFN
ncbi:TPA_asm: hypothetical protein HUJ06_032051 [Nelumbo nucifera]|uniref:Uncharacterized protein n=1 Tax=Nelumbo nucifera TaxID=4432 RepID=A0A823A260_NELNU|nr:TPA_asm: hypothetical protein HUJ06_032051 [Nelumbo nucifera]